MIQFNICKKCECFLEHYGTVSCTAKVIDGENIIGYEIGFRGNWKKEMKLLKIPSNCNYLTEQLLNEWNHKK